MLRSAVLGLTGCGLTACNLGPHYKRPDIPPPQAWRGAPTLRAAGLAVFRLVAGIQLADPE